MSLQFLRDFNKNVSESLSILNEGIEITNGVTDTGNIHLPYIQQLSFSAVIAKNGVSRCCIWREIAQTELRSTRERGVIATNLDSGHQIDSVTDSSREVTADLTGDTFNNNGDIVGDDIPSDVVDTLSCPLGQGCIVNTVDPGIYSSSIEEILSFLRNVENALECRSFANRSLLDTQVLPVLCCLVSVWDLVDLFSKPSAPLLSKFGDIANIHSGVLSILSTALKLIDRILVYPEFLTCKSASNVVEYQLTPDLQQKQDDSDTIAVSGITRTDTTSQTPWASNRIEPSGSSVSCTYSASGFTYFGRVAIVTLTSDEYDRLKHCLALLNAVGIASDFGRTLLRAAGVCVGGIKLEERDTVLLSLKILEKLYTHNDLAYHLHHADDSLIYTIDNLDAFYIKWHIACNDTCFHCEKPIGIRGISDEIEDIEDGVLCTCLYDTNDAVSPNRHLIEAEVQSSVFGPSKLMTLVIDSGDMVLKTHITRLLMHMILSSCSFRRHFVSEGCLETLMNILEQCCNDQFGIINVSLSQIQEDYTEKQVSALEKELGLATSFLPYTMDSMLILRQCLFHNDWGRIDSSRMVSFVTQMTSTVLTTWLFYYIHGPGTVRDRENSVFTHSLSILLDMCCSLVTHKPGTVSSNLVAVSGRPVPDAHTALLTVNKLSETNHSTNIGLLKDVLDSGITDQVMFAAHLLCNRTRFGHHTPEKVLDEMMRFISTVAISSNGSIETRSILIHRLRTPTGDKLPRLYAYMYYDLLMRDLESLQMSVTSPFTARLHQFRIEMFGDLSYIPILMHWFLCLNDDRVLDSLKESHRCCLWMMVVTTGLYKVDERARDILEYSRDIYNHTLPTMFTPDQTEIEWRPIRNILEFSMSMITHESDRSTQVAYVGPDFVSTCINILEVSLGNQQLQLSEVTTVAMCTKTLCCLATLMSMDKSTLEVENLDIKPILGLLNLDNNGSYSNVRRLAAFVLVLMRVRGVQIVNSDFDLGTLMLVTKCLRELYTSSEHIQALKLLNDLEPVAHLDSTLASYEVMLDTFFKASSNTAPVQALWVIAWHKSNLYKFQLPPTIHRFIALFRRMLHVHVIDLLLNDILTCTSSESAHVSIFTKTDDEVEKLCQIHAEEISFAQERVDQLTAQVEILSKSYYVAEANAKALKDELEEYRKKYQPTE
ncbi:hypothetical protein BaOVIS_016470 [Babesia ovis]|uniref:Uncharacterized protein n=1 Tax=Babesia ovis TaxID=5869 RepID=A0A9W5TCL4_BABOV|nr:hypothetical protein BaOVIS_016470 [Babesia ovis]